METARYDVVILGRGTAGSNAARAAAKAGAERIALVYEPSLWNTCVEVGCMPTKSLLGYAESLKADHTWREAMVRKDTHVNRLLRALSESVADLACDHISGTARFIKDGKNAAVAVNEGERLIYGERYVVATGSEAFVPPVPGLRTLSYPRLITSDAVARRHTDLNGPPRSLLVVGAGPIGLEMTAFFAYLGTEVTLVQIADVLTIFDAEFRAEREAIFACTAGVTFFSHATLKEVRETDKGLCCVVEKDGKEVVCEVEQILAAAGRRPRVEALGFDAVGVDLERGRVVHDEYLATANPRVYAAGDVVGHDQILHMAAEMGKVAGWNAAGGNPRRAMDFDRFLMAVTFDDYPSAMIGLTEEEARRRGIDVATATRRFSEIGLGILKGCQFGLWKLVVERVSGKIIGSEILGPHAAGELIQVLSPIIYNGNTVADVLKMTWYHPTFAEILKSLANDICKQDDTLCPGM